MHLKLLLRWLWHTFWRICDRQQMHNAICPYAHGSDSEKEITKVWRTQILKWNRQFSQDVCPHFSHPKHLYGLEDFILVKSRLVNWDFKVLKFVHLCLVSFHQELFKIDFMFQLTYGILLTLLFKPPVHQTRTYTGRISTNLGVKYFCLAFRVYLNMLYSILQNQDFPTMWCFGLRTDLDPGGILQAISPLCQDFYA